MSTTKTSLNHPLYRSQSVDALHGIGKEPIFHPKRSLSEMRSDKRDSPKLIHVSRPILEKEVSEESNVSPVKYEQPAQNVSPVSTAEVTVHRDDSRSDVRQVLGFDKQFSVDTGMPNATLDLNNVSENKTDTRLANVERGGVDELDNSAQASQNQMPNQTDFANIFDTLTEQDKLDVIRLSYEDTFNDTSNVVEAEITPTVSNGELKSAPVKPERKKKRSSSSSSLDGDSQMSPRISNIEEDDVMTSLLLPPSEAPPPVPEDDHEEFEADEDVIKPQTKTRIISVNTDKIVFEPMSPAQLDISDASIDKTIIDRDDSSFDGDKTLVNSPERINRPPSPDEEPVQEDEIAPIQRMKGELELSPFIIVTEKGKHDVTVDGNSSVENIKVDMEAGNQKSEEIKNVSEQNKDDFEKDFPNLDMNLNFEADSVLFKETFPSQNTKERDSGMSYDISVTELESMESKMREEIAKQNESKRGSGGIAFEVRDDFTNGVQQTITTKSVHRTSSYELMRNTESPVERLIQNDRAASMKLDTNRSSEFEGGLDWSGKRLVRSGSFSEIPQDNSVKNWTDNQTFDDDVIEQHIKEDIKEDLDSTNLKKLARATEYKAKSKANDSDSDSRCRSLSSSSSDSSPERKSYDVTNGPDDGLGSSPDTETLKINPASKNEIISSVPVYNENGQSIAVTLNTSMDNDADC